MARPKGAYTVRLAEQAQADLSKIRSHTNSHCKCYKWSCECGCLRHVALPLVHNSNVIWYHKVVMKLKAISAMSKFSAESVAEVLGVAAQTVWRWAAAYKKDGVSALYPKPKKPKPSKLSEEQKAKVFSWLDSARTSDGEDTHWTLSHLRQAT